MAGGEGLAFKAAADHRRYQEVLGLLRPIDERQPHRDDGEGQYGRQSAELLSDEYMSDGLGRLRLLMLVFAIGERPRAIIREASGSDDRPWRSVLLSQPLYEQPQRVASRES